MKKFIGYSISKILVSINTRRKSLENDTMGVKWSKLYKIKRLTTVIE